MLLGLIRLGRTVTVVGTAQKENGWQRFAASRFLQATLLPVTATVRAATSVEPTTATSVEPTTTASVEAASTAIASTAADCASAMISAASYVAACVSGVTIITNVSSSIAVVIAAPIVSAAVITGMAVVATVSPITAMAPSPVIPGSGADKDAAFKPLWTIEPIWRASIRIVRIVAVLTDRRTIRISIVSVGGSTDRNSHSDLRRGIRNRHHQ